MLKKTCSALLLMAMASVSHAQVVAHDAWSRITAPSVPTGVVFVQLHNTGTQQDALIGASTNVAQKVELHNHIHDNGVMRMRQVKHIDIQAGKQVTLQPGGLHIMLMGLKQPLKRNQTFELTLQYQSGHQQTITVTVNNGEGMKAASEAQHAHSHAAH